MDIRQSFYTAIRNLYVNKLRFAQVMLSLVIAVAAVIVICNTCRLMVQQVETSWTPDILSNIDVYINTRVELDKRPTIENLDEIVKNNPDVLLGASPYITNHTMTGNVRYDNKYCKEAYFIGVNEKYADLENVNVQEGRFIQYMDCRLMNGNAIGKTLNIWGINHTVIGVMEENSPDTTFNGLIYLPYTSAQKIIGDRIQTGYQDEKYYVNRFQIKANGIENLGNARRLIIDAMNELLGENNWSLTFASYLTLKGDIKGFVISQAFYYMLVVFAVLIVGGVGIMNVMLASVQERTKEIGIRKAFGATNKDIQRQFMLEAVITSLIGGLIGVVLGVILSFSIPWLVSDMTIGNSGMSYSTSYLEISLAAWPILLALGVSVGVGIIFGNYPAQQAAKLEPVAAINSD